MNEQLMERIITRILSDEGYEGRREAFDMAHWVDPAFQRDEEGYPTDKVDVCRTTCCIAGEAVLLDLLDSSVPHAVAISQLSVWDKAATGHVQHRAAELLDLPYSQTFMSPTPRLFFKEDWPIYYQDLAYVPWDQSDDPEYNHQAVAAAALMRDMIDGKVVRVTFDDDPEWHDPFGEFWDQFTS